MTSCFGCHLSMQANRKMPNRHNEGENSRNYTTYNFQVLRDDVFMLGRDGTVTGHRIAPVRSSSAVLVSSQNQNREWIYSQQQTISAEGYSGQAFNTHVPHTVRATETKGCTDCHVSKTTTTTHGWRNSCCKAQTSRTSWDDIFTSPPKTRSKSCPSQNTQNRRPSSAALCTKSPTLILTPNSSMKDAN
jgi:hypothetical protein